MALNLRQFRTHYLLILLESNMVCDVFMNVLDQDLKATFYKIVPASYRIEIQWKKKGLKNQGEI